MAMWPNPCVRVCVSVSRVPAGRMEMESLPATRRVGVAAPLSVFRPAAWRKRVLCVLRPWDFFLFLQVTFKAKNS